ncbi:4-diphosphocytidyl-2C-methyl-D-erythritol kinase [Lysinibacillus yapensis]|uniref:4-diphosphocytidyl-2C-methyl-D-erythritol kinase n=1 Tax=Ureibacillus yapensis TaxID=2304605 RepID=A0A396SFN3_9BACL|nr:4-diphosphocytidyl-2C-methyl-D-erythritol kinase [Lysinibacillus yapensis]RHW39852.1 4-diphosphocytidyl-2C-methyl-D-erythritol kinase [Lysinibacillus yapensis]
MEEPLLFISSPPFYFTEVEKTEIPFIEESTSVFVPNRSDRIVDGLIARQLHFFSQPTNQFRTLIFHLTNGEKVIGRLQGVEGTNVHIQSIDQKIVINANDIETITLKND